MDSTSSRLKTSSLVSVLSLKTYISDGMEVMELNKKYNKAAKIFHQTLTGQHASPAAGSHMFTDC